MDNVAHALVGAALGRAVGSVKISYAGLLGAVGANAPDLAELIVVPPLPRALHLVEHRGITHSIAGAVVLAGAITLATVIATRWWARRRGRVPPRAAWIFAVAVATVASHLVMDWQGSYGLRPFLPWSERWYYGDFVAIVDAWYWLVPLVALAWGASRHWRPALWYGLLLVPTTFAVLLLDQPALWVKVGWVVVAAVGVIGWVRHWFGPARAGLAAAVAVGVLALYAGAQAAAALPVKAELRRAATARFGPHAASAALTIPGRPFVWQPMLAGADTIAGRDWALPRNLGVPAVRRALTDTQEGRAMAIFARFLAARVDSADTPVRVHLWDVRYGGPGGGWAAVTVTLP